MQLLEGLTLRRIIQLRREKGQVFTLAEVEPIFTQLAAALDFAHKTVWHGDLKPENVLVLPDLLKVTDFCIIQGLPTKPFLAIQKARGAAYHYIAPEVRLEASRIDGRADIFSLGVMFAEMVTGELFEAHGAKAFQAAAEKLPRPVEQLIRGATHESPDARPQNAVEFADRIAELAAQAEGLEPLPADPGPARTSLPPPPPPVSDVHDSENLVQQAESSIPQLSESSVIMLEETVARDGGQTDITRVPDALQDRQLQVSQETPRLPVQDVLAHHAADADPKKTDEQRIGALLRRQGSTENVDGPDALAAPPGIVPPPLPLTDPRRVLHEPTAPDSEGETVPAKRVDVEVRLAALGGNGQTPLSEPLAPPPPLPDEPSVSGSLPGLLSSGFGVSPVSAPAEGQGGRQVIHDALTTLRPHPHLDRPREPPALPFSGLTGIPPGEPSEPGSPKPPPAAEPRKRGMVPVWANFAAIGLVVGAAAFGLIRALAGDPTQDPPQLAPPVVSSPPPHASLEATRAEAAPPPPVPAPDPLPPVSAQPPPAEPTPEPPSQAVAAVPVAEPKPVLPKKETPRPDPQGQPKSDEALAETRRREEERKAEALEHVRQREEERKRLAEEERRLKEGESKRLAEEKKRQDEEVQAAKAKEVAAVVTPSGPAVPQGCPRGMALIPAGAFKMGSAGGDPMHNFEEKRMESVEVPAFCVDYYEYPNSKSAKPTTSVSWFQAQELCKAKSKRLCEEQEWEKACKGADSNRYPYGNTWDADLCNTQDVEGNDRELAEQKAFPKCRSGYGLINMSGNASEWVGSTFSPSVKDRVHKGGAANRPDWGTRCANRSNLAPSAKNPFLGFRCCAAPAPITE
jgi:formylglycine-generating enzyme required for sulfatase activity